MRKPKRPEKTAEEKAVEKRQSLLLDKEIEESEERLKSLARGRLGRASMLSGAPTNAAQAAGKGQSRTGGASLLSGGGAGGGYSAKGSKNKIAAQATR